MGSFDEAINQERERAAHRTNAATAAERAKAEAAQQAAALIREAAEKFAALDGLQLILVRPRKFFDRGKAIVSTIGEKPGTYTAVDSMRCWAISGHRLSYSHLVLTERGRLASIPFHSRITIHPESTMVVAESDLGEPNVKRAFTPSGDMTGRADRYIHHLRDVLARTFVSYERTTTAARASARRT